MRFALLGDHPDGLAVAAAFLDTERHELAYYSGPPLEPAWRERFHQAAEQNDVEEILADPGIEFVVVASKLELRMPHLRRVLQSERHALCVHPVSDKPDAAYEVGMLQQETRHVVLPLLGHGLHSAVRRMREVLAAQRKPAATAGASRALEGRKPTSDVRITASLPGNLAAAEHRASVQLLAETNGAATVMGTMAGELLVLEYSAREAALFNAESDALVPGIPIWDLLRAIGGEIVEVAALGPSEELTTTAPVLLSGQVGEGMLFSATLLSHQRSERLQVRVLGGASEVELLFPHGWPGPAVLGWRGDDGEWCEESWDARGIWPEVVAEFEKAIVALLPSPPIRGRGFGGERVTLHWQDAIRSLELDDAARRSVKRRKAIHVEYPEASEEVSFKGTMTLVGCAILWGIIVLAVVSHWVPWLRWGVVPLLGLFLFMQVFRWVIPAREAPEKQT